MIESMTGYGSAEQGGFKVEVKSLNHRYLDVSVRMPSFLMEHEVAIRRQVKDFFDRGKVDITVTLSDKRHRKVSVNPEIAKSLHDAFANLQRDLSLPGTLTIDFFSGFREVLVADEPETDPESLFGAVSEALGRVREMRRREGAALVAELNERIAIIKKHREDIAGRAKEATLAYRDKLSRRLDELMPGLAREDNRIAQEIALMAQKGDITEELTRLISHLGQFGAILGSGMPAGRKLDFLLQELNREVNTIASKADDIGIINLTIEMKNEIEKLREQSQNIQ